MNHTPGKWYSTDAMKDIFNGCTVIASEEVDDAIICSMGGDMFEADANARLIAAAPTMLEALKNIENDDKHMPASAWKLIQDAIKLAEGAE